MNEWHAMQQSNRCDFGYAKNVVCLYIIAYVLVIWNDFLLENGLFLVSEVTESIRVVAMFTFLTIKFKLFIQRNEMRMGKE